MRFVLAFLLVLLALPAYALEVIAGGFGNTYEESLRNAKMVALDKVNGAWINGDSYVRNGMFSEKITQYNGGVIRKYEILKNDVTFVIIKADVVPRDSNTVHANSGDVSSEMRGELDGRRDNFNARQKAIKVVDNRERAIAFKVNSIKYENQGQSTIVVIRGVASLQPMWVQSYQELQKEAGYFDLDNFYRPLYVNVTGYDTGVVATTTTNKFYDELSLWTAAPFGIVIRPKYSDEVELKVKVDTDTLKKVDKFEVRFL